MYNNDKNSATFSTVNSMHYVHVQLKNNLCSAELHNDLMKQYDRLLKL